MNLFQVLDISGKLAPSNCKIHLATYNGIDDPIDVYFAGEFQEWHSVQNNPNFERGFIIALIKLKQPNCQTGHRIMAICIVQRSGHLLNNR